MRQPAEYPSGDPVAFSCLFLLASLALGCDEHSTPQASGLPRDSAGIRIVENFADTWAAPWEVRPEALVTIGSVDEDVDQALDGVTGAVRLGNGRIAVANGGSSELLFFDEGGTLLRRGGGEGGGPGEFQSLEWLARYGLDSIVALDVLGQRVSYFDDDGNFIGSVRLEPNAVIPFPRPVGFFADGSFLATKGTFVLGADPPAGRRERPLEPLFHISSDGKAATLLGSFPGVERVVVPTGPGGRLERRKQPFGSETAFAAGGSRFYVADNASYEIRVYAMTGQLTQVIRKESPALEVDAADVRRFEDSVLAAADSRARPQTRVLLASFSPPPTYPAFEPDIRVDDDLNLWVRECARVGDRASRWSVFTAAGELLGTLEMPSGLDPMDIGSDYVLGLRRDELGVEYVQLHRLHRGR